MTHSKLSPSKAHRWLPCPGSLQYDTEEPESVYAEEGSFAHAILEQVLKGNPVLTGDMFNGKPATAERIQQAIEIRDYIAQWKEQHPDFVMEIETHIKISPALGYHSRNDFDGTADMGAYNPTTKEIVILDAKFGFVRVEPKDNPQLYLYATGMLWDMSQVFDKNIESWNITVIIAQPDYEGVVQFREHRMTYRDLWNWYSVNRDFINRAAAGDETINPSSEHACRYCPGRFECGPRLEVLKDFAKEEWRMTKTLGEMLPMLAQIRHIADDLETEAVRMLARGEPVPGFKLVESRSIRKWSVNHDVIGAAEKRGWKADKFAPHKLLSPAQMEKAFGQEGKEFVKELAVTPRGAPKLAPDSDPRPAYTPDNFTQEEIDSMLKEE